MKFAVVAAFILIFNVKASFCQTDKIVAYYQIQDYTTVLKLLEKEDGSTSLFRLKLELLSKLGFTKEVIKEIKNNLDVVNLSKENFLTLENLAWSVLINQKDTGELSQIASLVGAYSSRDAKAVLLLKKSLSSSNAKIRAISAKFSTSFPDDMIKDAILERISVEQNEFVLIELLNSAGKLKIQTIRPFLENLLLKENLSEALKAQAVISFVDLYEKIKPEDVRFFLNSKRAGWKILGLRLLMEMENFPEELFQDLTCLLDDSAPMVINEVMFYLGFYCQNKTLPGLLSKKIEELTNSTHPTIKLVSAWVKSRNEKILNSKILEFLNSDSQESRVLASCLLGMLGDISLKELNLGLDHRDHYVRLNCALGLLQNQKYTKSAIETLEKILLSKDMLISIDSSIHPMVNLFSVSKVRHHPFMPNYPKIMDGMARLRIIEKMAIFDSSCIKKPLEQLLLQKEAILTFYTLGLILQEDIENFSVMKELTFDQNSSVALAASLALAFMAKDPDVLNRLIELFDKVGFEEKMHILEALGALGDRKSIPFLLKCMDMPFLSMQIIASSALIQCLYH